jgi:hypothetical protein
MLYHDVHTKALRLVQQNGEVSLREATLFIEADTETYRDYSNHGPIVDEKFFLRAHVEI